MSITYLTGDATRPIGDDHRLIVHCCNDAGGWGSGFVVAVSKRWSTPENAYRRWHAAGSDAGVPFELGKVQRVWAQEHIWVINLVGQHGYGKPTDPGYPFVRYEALEEGLTQVASWAREMNASIHMPRMGCGRAGGEWAQVEQIIDETCHDLRVFVYDPEL